MKTMTEEQEEHLKRIKTKFALRLDSKYRLGQKEHGGDLMHNNTIQLLDKAIAETTDLIVYLETLRDNLVGK